MQPAKLISLMPITLEGKKLYAMLHSFSSYKCENQFQLLCALELLLLFVQEPKQSVNEGRNHCSRESLSQSILWQEENSSVCGTFCSQKFLWYQYKTSERKYLTKDNRKCKSCLKVSIL